MDQCTGVPVRTLDPVAEDIPCHDAPSQPTRHDMHRRMVPAEPDYSGSLAIGSIQVEFGT